MSRPPLRFAVYAMEGGPERPPVCEADSWTGALLAMACQANEGAPGWYVVVDRARRAGPNTTEAVHTYMAPEGVTVEGLRAMPAHRPWVLASRRDAQVGA